MCYLVVLNYVFTLLLAAKLASDARGTRGVPRKGVWTSVNMRVWTCKESKVKHNQTSCYLRPPFLGTPLVPSRSESPAAAVFRVTPRIGVRAHVSRRSEPSDILTPPHTQTTHLPKRARRTSGSKPRASPFAVEPDRQSKALRATVPRLHDIV